MIGQVHIEERNSITVFHSFELLIENEIPRVNMTIISICQLKASPNKLSASKTSTISLSEAGSTCKSTLFNSNKRDNL